ncbi:MAG: DUF1592 domain-containing protein [Bryobacteraceae bacterium]
MIRFLCAFLCTGLLYPADGTGAFVDRYCLGCHNQKSKTGGLSLEGVDASRPESQAAIWERVVTRLRMGSMPPPGLPRPDAATYRSVATTLEGAIDKAWMAAPEPGRIGAVHRLNRAEYNNAIRDLLALDVDVKSLLPGDETADGSFDNFASSLTISPAHLERYLSVARQVTRLAVGIAPAAPSADTYRIALHVLQDDRMSEDLPFGTRGGLAVKQVFPADGDYQIKVRLQRQYQDYLKGIGWAQLLEVRLDGKLLKRFTVGGGAKGRAAAASYAGDGEPGFAGDPEWEQYMQTGGDAGLEVKARVTAGPHLVGVAFVREMFEPEGLPQPLQRGRVIANDQVYMDHANVGSVQIGGPLGAVAAPQGASTPSRRAILICTPGSANEEKGCAQKILSRMARLAYRRPATKEDVRTLMEFFEQGRREGGSFDHGVQFALERMLVDPDFLLRVHRDPAKVKGPVYRMDDLELASRLSFFLWSSIPDDRLLTAAERGELSKPGGLEREARRMLADPRAADALVANFVSQWLNLRRVEEVVVDPIRYPNYDESLLQAFRRETEMFVASTIREDRSVHELLSADYTFVNERLARHYGIGGVTGSAFRRVALPNREQRGGILAQGAILATTSYPDRTSPVLRGKWLLNNILGLPVPNPPAGLDTTLDAKTAKTASIRERLAQHRKNPACNSCHTAIDPLGFALEGFDVIGGWRVRDDASKPVDSIGTMLSGAQVNGFSGLREFLLSEPEQFPRTVSGKLLSYALGRRLEHYDQPAVRQIAREAAGQGYKWSAIVLNIIRSPAFTMRDSRPEAN